MVNASWANSMRAYYSVGAVPVGTIKPYPPGLQLIAGDPGSTGSPGTGAVAFSCGLGVNEPGWTAQPVECPGPTSVRVAFPQCWDGRTLTAPGNARDAIGKACPKGFPVALPLLRIVAVTKGRTSPASFALSVGAASRMHADFWNAWDPTVLDELVSICIRGERESNRDVKRCRLVGTGPASVGSSAKETNF